VVITKRTATDRKEVMALELFRILPRLRRLSLSFRGAVEDSFPHFIPSSLKALSIEDTVGATREALLRSLPGMLQTSGARLEEIRIGGGSKLSAEGAAAVAQVLRVYSPALKTAKLIPVGVACTGVVAPSVTCCCDTLEVLHCRLNLFSALPPATCPSFPRLVELCLSGASMNHVNFLRVWDVMARGRLPALATLYIRAESEVYGISLLEDQASGAGARLGRAFEAVAGTLKRLDARLHRGL
jgi:hypothetical protein